MEHLKTMMEMQEQLNTNVINKVNARHYNPAKDKQTLLMIEQGLGFDDATTDEDNRRKWADKFMSALQAEVCETREALTQEVKWWKNSTKDLDGCKEEVIDCFHFLMSAALALGMNSEEVFNRYCEKNKKNFERKDWTVNQ